MMTPKLKTCRAVLLFMHDILTNKIHTKISNNFIFNGNDQQSRLIQIFNRKLYCKSKNPLITLCDNFNITSNEFLHSTSRTNNKCKIKKIDNSKFGLIKI